MKYSKRKLTTMINCFKRALVILPSELMQPYPAPHRSPYICDCINRTSDYSPAADVATDFIAERIGHVFSIERWLKDQSDEIADAVQYDVLYNNGRKLQTYRKAWLKSMIAELEATV